VHEDGGVWLRVLAGEAFGLRSPVKVYSPLFYAHAALAPGARLDLPRSLAERGAYLVSGAVRANGAELPLGQMIVGDENTLLELEAAAPSVLMLLGGEPVGERFIEWNFVSSSKERIEQAKADWRAGRMKLPDADNAEFIPLPPDLHTSAGPMS
jgi:redox-sensitive bicupin YhaK (pirin superfamily)